MNAAAASRHEGGSPREFRRALRHDLDVGDVAEIEIGDGNVVAGFTNGRFGDVAEAKRYGR